MSRFKQDILKLSQLKVGECHLSVHSGTTCTVPSPVPAAAGRASLAEGKADEGKLLAGEV